MAKISANGCTKLASAEKTKSEDGAHRRYRLVLRSDGVVLGALDFRYGSRWQRGGFSHVAKVRPGADKLKVFRAYAERREYQLQ